MKKIPLLILLSVTPLIPTMAKDPAVCPLYETTELVTLARKSSVQAQLAGDLKEKRRLAQEGMFYANQCLEKDKNNAGCVYYRAVNRGLDLETRTVSVKKGLKELVNDFKRVIELDAGYDNGGAYLALGYVSLEAPVLPVMGQGIRRDLDLAQSYAQKALNIAPHAPENLKLAGIIAYRKNDFKTALEYFKTALKFFRNPKSQNKLDSELYLGLKKWLKKSRKKLKGHAP